MQLQVAGFEPESITDGPGIRFVVFVQGCPHHCEGCHNPQTWPFEGGRSWDIEAVLVKISSDPLVHGVTFSGGEPFAQPAALAQLAIRLRAAGYEVASYTGYSLEELLTLAKTNADIKTLLENIDVLVDGRFVQSQKSLELKFRGSRNQRILDVPSSLAADAPVLKQDGRWD